jgi:glutamine amidotransferase-like uncharacterized protein
MYEALHPHYDIDIVDAKKLKNINRYDIVAFPGGIGDADRFDQLLHSQIDTVKNYVAGGGRYLGICMGAYWAAHHYFDILKSTTATQYIYRPGSEIRRSYGTTAQVDWLGTQENMYFYDGCAFTGTGFDTVATYANGDAMAIVQGRIGLIGCHPESMPSWYDRLYLKPHWHEFRHHRLLLDFVNNLMEQ